MIRSTWGDKYYVGLSGIEFFDERGNVIKLRNAQKQLRADPADINVLNEYGKDPRTIDKLVDGVYRTCSDLHQWLAPYTKGKDNKIFVDFGQTVGLSMIRIWNYNKSRIHSYRGARDIEISLDGVRIFKGEVRKGSGVIKGAENHCEYILFINDEKDADVI